MSLYSMYIKERLGKEIVEDHRGFATYYFVNDGCYLEDLFVHPDYRCSGVATELADKVCEIALSRGVRKLYGSIVPSASGSTEALKVFLSYGCRIDSSTNNFIVLVKDIEITLVAGSKS